MINQANMTNMKTTLFLICFTALTQILGQENSKVRPLSPEIFVQFPNVRDFTISPSEDEAYFTALSPKGELSVIIMLKKTVDKWAEPEIVRFSGKYTDLEPFLSPDGLRLYYVSNRPLDDSENKVKDFDIWYVERDSRDHKWSKPINVGEVVNTDQDEFYPTISSNNNLYFTTVKPESNMKDDIYMSSWDGNTYLPPISLSDSINSDGYEFNAFVSPKEDFIIFSGWNRPDGVGGGDLYISYRNSDNMWSKAENLGREINSGLVDYCPYVNMSTGILYFTSKRSNVKIEETGYTNFQKFLNEITKYENGFSRIYKISIKGKLPKY